MNALDYITSVKSFLEGFLSDPVGTKIYVLASEGDCCPDYSGLLNEVKLKPSKFLTML